MKNMKDSFNFFLRFLIQQDKANYFLRMETFVGYLILKPYL